jgi:hypothetical protein
VYDVGTPVTLVATAAAGSRFLGWSGGGCSGIGACRLTVGADTGVFATFTVVVPPAPILTASSSGTTAVVRGFDGTGQPAASPFVAYAPDFAGGAVVAAGDVFGTGTAVVVTGPGPGLEPLVRAFDPGGAPLGPGFVAYDPGFRGGVRLAVCDVDGDGRDEIVTAAGPGGGAHVRVVRLAADGTAEGELLGFLAYAPGFTGGAWVGCGDVDGDGRADVVVGAGAGGGPHVRAFSLVDGGLREVLGFFAFDPGLRSGVRVAAGDVDGDGRAEIVVGAGPGGGPHVRVLAWSGAALEERASFFAYAPGFVGGVFVAAGDVDGDGRAEVVTGPGAGGGPHVRVFTGSGAATGGEFFAYDPSFGGGVAVGAAP